MLSVGNPFSDPMQILKIADKQICEFCFLSPPKRTGGKLEDMFFPPETAILKLTKATGFVSFRKTSRGLVEPESGSMWAYGDFSSTSPPFSFKAESGLNGNRNRTEVVSVKLHVFFLLCLS